MNLSLMQFVKVIIRHEKYAANKDVINAQTNAGFSMYSNHSESRDFLIRMRYLKISSCVIMNNHDLFFI